jgi:hypothetical protein
MRKYGGNGVFRQRPCHRILPEKRWSVTQKSTAHTCGSIPILSFTAARMRCLEPRYRSVV